MAPPSEEEKTINQIKSLNEARTAAKKYNMNIKNLKRIEDFKTRLLLHLKNSTINQNMPTVLQDDNEMQWKLEKLYDKALTALQEPDKDIEEIVATQMETDNWPSKLQNNYEKLKNRDSMILVTGETSAGKSSLINLLIGEKILPEAVLHSTACITVIRYGEVKKFKIYQEESSDMDDTAKEYFFEDGNYSEQLYKHIAVCDENKGNSRVEIYWPIEFLKNGTCIIDSPGIGENQEMTKIVYNYAPNASAFIFVINSSNAGGTQKDKFLSSLNEIYKDQFRRATSFDPAVAIFVCNKWDEINHEEEEKTKNKIFNDIGKCWPNCSQEQIYYMSTANALMHCLNGGYVTDDYHQFLNGLQKLIPISAKRMIEINWRNLQLLVQNLVSNYRFRVHQLRKKNDKLQEQEMNMILYKLKSYENENEKKAIKNGLFLIIEDAANNCAKKLYDYLRSEDSKNMLLQWDRNDLPKDCTDFNKTEVELRKIIQNKIIQHMHQWEKDHEEIKHFDNGIRQIIDAKFENLSDLIEQIDQKAVGNEGNFDKTVDKSWSIQDFDYIHDLDITVASGWLPITDTAEFDEIIKAAVVNAGIKSFFEILSRRKAKYERDPVKYIQQLIPKVLRQLTQDSIQKMVLMQHETKFKERIEDIIEKIPRFCAAFNELMSFESKGSVGVQQILEEKKKKLDEFVDTYNQLTAFSIEYLKKYDHDPASILDRRKDLDMDQLGVGTASIVVERTFRNRKNGRDMQIALKIFDKGISLVDIIQEANILRNLNHGNIIRCLGTVEMTEATSHRATCLILELCNCSLYDYLQKRREKIPATFPNDPVARKQAFIEATLPFSRQIAAAVAHLHDRGYARIYPSLNFNNVLIGHNDRIKLCGVGLTTRFEESDDVGRRSVFFKYLAPEIHEGKDYDIKTDVYSMAIIFWELWYGVCISRNENSFQQDFEKATTDRFLSLFFSPSVFEPFAMLIRECWLEEPKQRLSSEACLKKLLDIEWK